MISAATMRAADSVYLSDPVHGFISVPRDVLLPLLQTPHVQRLRRIRQLGVGFLVFPGAEHSRFTHATGAMALMQDALDILEGKGTPISKEERQAAMAAALLHDIGHAPFSHTLELHLIQDTPHEAISGILIKSIADKVGPPLDLALAMFNGSYERSFFHDLIASQLDMDRLDYLRRDSHLTGVIEGRIGLERILHTMCVHPTSGGPGSHVAVEWKGIYAVENMLIARHLMYWQVYLHKAVVAGDQLLCSVIKRARKWLAEGNDDAIAGMTPPLRFFLERTIHKSDLADRSVLNTFLRCDDTDVVGSLKAWASSPDKILADLAQRFLQRDMFRCTFLDVEPPECKMGGWKERIADLLCVKGLSTPPCAIEDATYYLTKGRARHAAYARSEGPIRVVNKSGELCELSGIADTPAIEALTNFVEKVFVCYPKEIDLAV